MLIQLPQNVKYIIETLIDAGYEAYAVGGCIRDSLLGRSPEDWDITTSAHPYEVKGIFPRTIDTGIQHGTVTVMIDGEGFEVTTYRIDGEYEDARHPKEVAFTENLIEDLKRRDFTINAMAYNERYGLIDAFEGENDLQKGIIRCVGDPMLRFTEDALRMLRAVRFSAQLGFEIENGTKEAITALASNLKKISAERIQIELVKLLVSPNPQQIRVLYETGISKEIFPWFDAMMETQQNNSYHCYNVGEHTIEALKNIPADKVLRLTMLLHDVAKPVCKTVDEVGVYHFQGHQEKGEQMAKKILRELKFDNHTINKVSRLVRFHDTNPAITAANVRRSIYYIGEEQFPDLFLVKRADAMGKRVCKQEEMLERVADYERQYEEIMARGDCVSLKNLAVKGSDLIQAGIKPGKEIGEILDRMLKLVLEHPESNQKEILLRKLKRWV